MWECKKCKGVFKTPTIRKIDAGFNEGILGLPRNKHSILFCPECRSLKIKRKAG